MKRCEKKLWKKARDGIFISNFNYFLLINFLLKKTFRKKYLKKYFIPWKNKKYFSCEILLICRNFMGQTIRMMLEFKDINQYLIFKTKNITKNLKVSLPGFWCNIIFLVLRKWRIVMAQTKLLRHKNVYAPFLCIFFNYFKIELKFC